ncbi:MAG: RsbRD N-terminal domain-containing protein [Calditrichia bacterium]|jgi:hypothetical protein|nr:RsbRD N-terminal domain-containing protein [Calditrichia bacterium]
MSDKLVELIEKNAKQLSINWLSDVRKHPNTPTYHKYDEEELYNRVFDVYSRLSKWISKETSKEELYEHYSALGLQRRKEGFALSEVIQALIISRRHIWLKVMSEGFLDTALDMYKALELNNRVILFFDRAIHYTALGFEIVD